MRNWLCCAIFVVLLNMDGHDLKDMTINERLYILGLAECFESAIKKPKQIESVAGIWPRFVGNSYTFVWDL